ncbi:unnamed protein product, partial [Medioppia subpectinata]
MGTLSSVTTIMNNNNNENDVFMAAFEPLAVGRKSGKRRSSILKTIEANYCGEERRASRRISWAPTYQYKYVICDTPPLLSPVLFIVSELLADGTAVIKCQELNSLKVEDVVSPPSETIDPPVEQNVIKSSDFINRLKAKSKDRSVTGEPSSAAAAPTLPEEEAPSQDCSRPKRSRKGSSKGLSKYLAKHYDTAVEDDVETVFNTSYNKYGREVAPRTDQISDFTQLFTDDNNMSVTFVAPQDLTSAAVSGQTASQTTDAMSITLCDPSMVSMSVCDTTSTQDHQKTRCFTDEGLDMTSNSSDAMALTLQTTNQIDTELSGRLDLTKSPDLSEEVIQECDEFEAKQEVDITAEPEESLDDKLQEPVITAVPTVEAIDTSVESNAEESDAESVDVRDVEAPTERTDFTQLFSTDNNMSVTSVVFQDITAPKASQHTAEAMSITLNYPSNEMSMSGCDTTAAQEKTQCFADEGLDMTSVSSPQELREPVDDRDSSAGETMALTLKDSSDLSMSICDTSAADEDNHKTVNTSDVSMSICDTSAEDKQKTADLS